MHGEDSVNLFVGSLHARDLNMAAAIAKVAAHIQTVRHHMWWHLHAESAPTADSFLLPHSSGADMFGIGFASKGNGE